ncbi:MAG: alpha-L-rhamnosidase [Bacteroidales bacterium]|nr:alpha-L-rhamnosidase [Bacteroidales bacterium]
MNKFKTLLILSVLLLTATDIPSWGNVDSRIRKYISPVKIVWTECPDRITNVDYLLREGNGQADLTNSHICVMKSTGTEHPAVLLDFGRELHGGLQIVTGMPASHAPVRIRVRFGESASEAMCNIDGVNGATNDHAVRDFETTVPWLGVKEFGNSGYRFVRIDLLDDNAELHLKEVRAISVYRDLPYRGSFRCSDERLNEIWQTGAYTVHLCMQDYLWDGIKRDRLVWMGDMHPEVMTVSQVFGYTDVVPASLDLARDITPLPKWMSGMYTYSLWWVIVQRDWFRFHGDKAYLEQQRSYLTRLLEILLGHVDENGFEKSGGGFLDWPSNANRPAMIAGTQALMMMTMDAGAELCGALGEKELAEKCSACHKRMAAVAKTVSERYSKDAKAPGEPGSKQAAALMILADMVDARKVSDEILKVEGARGFSTFYGYYMLQAMAEAGDYETAMDIIRRFWGAMLDLGATTFWEDFNIDWLKEDVAPIDGLVPPGKKDIHGGFGAYCYKGFRHSLCHGWASGPTAWLSANVLGVKIIEPGYKVIRVEPHLGDLQWAEGTVPTPYGEIKVSHRKGTDGKVVSKIEVPEGIKIIK